MGNTEIGVTDLPDVDLESSTKQTSFSVGSGTKSKPQQKKSPFQSDIPHLTPQAVQPVPSFIIKNTSSGAILQESRWCRVRVVLLQQTHGSRTILFDSKKSFMKTFPGAHDRKLMGDLVFGSTPFAHSNRDTSTSSHIKSISTKVHYLPYFRQTVVSKLFHLRIPKQQLSEVLFPSFEMTSSSEESSSSFSDSDDGLGSHIPDFSESKCFECKPLFALVVLFEIYLPVQSSLKNVRRPSSGGISVKPKTRIDSSKARKKKTSRSRIRSHSSSEREDSQQEMVYEKRKMIELQAFVFCSLSVLMNQIQELQEEVCRSLRKTIIKVMKKWKKKKKKSINDLITPLSPESSKSSKIRELNLKLSSFILDHDPPFLSHCRHFEEYILTYLHSQKSASPSDSSRDGGRMIPGGHGFFSRGGGLWQKVLMSGSGTTPRGLLPRTTWKNDGKVYGDPKETLDRASVSLKTVWGQLEDDIMKLIQYISKRKMIHMGWTKEFQSSQKGKGGGGKGSSRDRLKPQQPLERRVIHLTKRFLCSVLSAVFSHHTGWIFPFVRDGNRTGVEDQLESVFGGRGIGKDKEGSKYCKVLVVGNDYKIVRQLLVVLSFFLRSNPYLMKQYSINPSPQSLSTVKVKKPNERVQKKSNIRKKKEEIEKEEEEEDDDEMVLKLYEILPIESFVEDGEEEEKKKEKKNQSTLEKSFLSYYGLSSKNMYFSHHLSIPFGESLVFSEILPKYCPAYVLSAIPKNVDYFEGTIRSLRWDLEKSPHVDTSCCIVVDMNDLMCNVVMAHRNPSSSKSKNEKKKSKKIRKTEKPSSSGKINIDFKESVCSPFVLELFNQTLEIFNWGEELKNQHLLLNNFFNQKLKESIILAQLIVDWIEKERNKAMVLRNQHLKGLKKKIKVKLEEEEEEEESGEEEEQQQEQEEEFLFEINEKQICKELNIPTNDFPIMKNIVGYIRPDILRCIKN